MLRKRWACRTPSAHWRSERSPILRSGMCHSRRNWLIGLAPICCASAIMRADPASEIAMNEIRNTRIIRAPRGPKISCRNLSSESAMRMLMNNLDLEVAERPQDLVVYGGIGKAARNWECFETIVRCLRELEGDETLLVQSGKPVGVFKTHADAPRVLISNSMLVPAWATWEHFYELDRKGLMMYGQMTAGSWTVSYTHLTLPTSDL